MSEPPFAEFNYQLVAKWMRTQLRAEPEVYLGAGGEVNCTLLAENAAAHFKANDQPGPLDDPEHFIWTAATSTAAWWQKQPKLGVVK